MFTVKGCCWGSRISLDQFSPQSAIASEVPFNTRQFTMMERQSEKPVATIPESPTGDVKREEPSVYDDEPFLFDPAEEKAVIRKIDFIIMPAMTFVYFFQCMSPYPSPPLFSFSSQEPTNDQWAPRPR